PLVPLDRYKPELESRFSRLLGRKVTIGSARLTLLRGPALEIKGMTAKEDPAFGEGNMLEADSVRAGLAILPLLLRRQFVLKSLEMASPRLAFTKSGSGLWSWSTMGAMGRPASSSASSRPTGALFVFLRAWAQSTSAVSHGRLGLCAITFPRVAAAAEDAGLAPGRIVAPAFAEAATAGDYVIQLKGATLELIDRSARYPASPRTRYRNLDLSVAISSPPDGSRGSHASGTLRAGSEQADGSEKVFDELPFDLRFEKKGSSNISIKGSIGPGSVETRNFAAQSFKSSIDADGRKATLDQIEAALYDGTLKGRSEIDMSGPRTRFLAEGDVQNLNIDQAITGKLDIPGQITGHVNSRFKLSGDVDNFPAALAALSGAGQVSSDDLFVSGLNLSAQVARALKVDRIGDMSPGTRIGHIETAFQVEQGTLTANNLHIERIAGLGDAASAQGRIKVSEQNGKSSVSMDFPATITMSAEAMGQVKSAMPLLGAAMSLLAGGSRVTIPITIQGDVRNPSVQVNLLGFGVSGGG